MLSKQQLLSLALVVGLLTLHLPVPSQASLNSEVEPSLSTECIIRIVNALITSLNNFILDFGLGLTLCGFTSCAVIPGLNMIFVADCLACIGAAIPFFGPIPDNVCS